MSDFNGNINLPREFSSKIMVPKEILYEKIERALFKGNLKIEDLFLVIPVSNRDGEGEIMLETKYGKLRTFFCKSLDEFQKYGRETPQGLLLSSKKFKYPTISKTSTRPVSDLSGSKSHIIN